MKTKRYSINGKSCDFYIYSFELCRFSGWIKGRSHEFFHLQKLFKKSKSEFDSECGKYFQLK